MSVHQNSSVLRIVESRNQTQQSAFARAGHAKDTDDLARLGFERNVVQNRIFGIVAEGDILKHHPARQTRRDDGAGFVFHAQRSVHHLEDAAGGGETLLNGIGDGGNVGNLAVELLQQSGEDHQPAAQRNLSFDIQPSAVTKKNDEAELGQQLRHGSEDGQVPKDAALLI